MTHVIRSRVRAPHASPVMSPVASPVMSPAVSPGVAGAAHRRPRSPVDAESVAVLHRAAEALMDDIAGLTHRLVAALRDKEAGLPGGDRGRRRGDLARGEPLAAAQRRLPDPAPGVARGGLPPVVADRRVPGRTGPAAGRVAACLPARRRDGVAGPRGRDHPAPSRGHPAARARRRRRLELRGRALRPRRRRVPGHGAPASPGAGRTTSG